MIQVLMGRMKRSEIEQEHALIERNAEEFELINYNLEMKLKYFHETISSVIRQCCVIDVEQRNVSYDEVLKGLEVMKIILQTREIGITSGKYKIAAGQIDIKKTFTSLVETLRNGKNMLKR